MDFPFGYKPIAATTWAYLSSLLMLCVFFKFNRFWSFRNVDLVLIILLCPGILFIEGGKQWNEEQQRTAEPPVAESGEEPGETANIESPKDSSNNGEFDAAAQGMSAQFAKGNALQRWGYIWLFSIGAVFMVRMLFDPMLVRRPLLEPNLTIGALVFLGCSLMIFLFANIVTSNPTSDDLRGARDAVKMLQREPTTESETAQLRQSGPGYTLFNLIPVIPSFGNEIDILETDPYTDQNMSKYVVTAKSLAIASQIFVVLGLILFGHYHFNNFETGVAMAVVYLMLPYTAVFTGHALHVLPAALLVWAMVAYSRPFVAGVFIGLATGVAYYPIFLLPLWISFYWERGRMKFVLGVLLSVTVCIAGLVFTSTDVPHFLEQLQAMFGFWKPIMKGLGGIWALGWNQWYRLPIMVAFVALSVSFAFWPTQKNIGTLISYSCVLMVAVQFWLGFGDGGGLYMAWYIPLALLAIFRPNTDGRIASVELIRAEENRRLKQDRVELSEI